MAGPILEMAQLFGILPVIEALRSGKRRIDRVMIQRGAVNPRHAEAERLARKAGVAVLRIDRRELERIARGQNHQGIAALLEDARRLDPADLIRSATPPALFVILDGVEDPHNLGAIIRTAEVCGASGLFLPEHRSARVTDTVAKASAGAVEFLPIAIAHNISQLIEDLKKSLVWIISIEPRAPKHYTEWDWTQPSAIVLGGEAKGARRLVREHCDDQFSIPLRGHVDSLNVSVAAGVVLFEAMRQRHFNSRP